MHRCPCSTRALELFIRDFTGLNIRQQRTQICSQRRSTFATSSAWRRPELVDTKASRGEFVPFAGAVRQGEEARQEKIKNDGQGRVEDGGNGVADEWRVDGGWHAEIKVIAPTDEQVVGEVAGAKVQTSDSTSMGTSPTTEPTSEYATDQADATMMLHSEPVAGTPSGGAQTKTKRRLERKKQRMAEGKFKPLAAARERGEAMEHRQSSVLSMIEKMEGPRVEKAKPKTPKEARSKADKAETRAGKDKHKTKATTPPVEQPPAPTLKKEPWQIQKAALSSKFGTQAWSPRKRLSPDTLDGIRALHASDPATYSTATLSSQFAISPENIRRILRSKWRPSDEEKEDRAARWERRGVRKWSEMADGGEKPPRRWREMGAGSLQGRPEEQPSWKRGGRRKGEREDVAWLDEEGEGEGEGLGGRIL